LTRQYRTLSPPSAACALCVLATLWAVSPASAYVLRVRDNAPPRVVATRALVVSEDPNSTALWLQLGVAAGGGPACWVQPIPGEVLEADAQPGEVLAALQAETAPRSLDLPRNQYGGRGCGGGDEADDELHAVPLGPAWEHQPGELRPATHGDSAQLRQWLGEQGCELTEKHAEELDRLSGQGWSFVSALLPEAPAYDAPTPGAPWVGAQAMRIRFDGPPTLHAPARAAGGSAAPQSWIWTLASGRPVLVAEHRLFEVRSPTHYRPEAFESMYARLVAEQLAAAGPGAVALEFAAPVGSVPPLAQTLVGAVGPGGPNRFVTRLYRGAGERHGDATLEIVPGSDRTPFRVRVIASAGSAGGSWGWALLAFLLTVAWLRRERRRASIPAPAVLALALSLLPVAGCLSSGGLRSAEITPRGRTDLLGGAAAARDPRHALDREAPVPEGTTTPRGAVPTLGVSRGLGGGYDLAAWVYPIGSRLELRRSLIDGSADGSLSLTMGVAGGVLWDPLQGERCLHTGPSGAVDGCYREQRWAAEADVPLTVSQHVGAVSWYAGIKAGVIWLRSDLSYEHHDGSFDPVEVSKETWRFSAGIFGGAELHLSEACGLIPELQILTSLNDSDRLVFYVVPGIGLRWRF